VPETFHCEDVQSSRVLKLDRVSGTAALNNAIQHGFHQCPSGRRLTHREFFDTVVGASVLREPAVRPVRLDCQ